MRTACAAALASVLANSVYSSAAGVDAAARAAAQSRLHRMRRADVDDSIDVGTGGGGDVKSSKSIRGRLDQVKAKVVDGEVTHMHA